MGVLERDRMSQRDEWSTPPAIYEAICDYWGVYPKLDVAARAENTRVPKNWFTLELDALKMSWRGLCCWMNPPYSQPLMTQFIEKAITESKNGATVLFLLPNWTDQAWYHDLIKPYPHEFWRGRIKFDPPADVKPSSPRYGSIHGVIRP